MQFFSSRLLKESEELANNRDTFYSASLYIHICCIVFLYYVVCNIYVLYLKAQNLVNSHMNTKTMQKFGNFQVFGVSCNEVFVKSENSLKRTIFMYLVEIRVKFLSDDHIKFNL